MSFVNAGRSIQRYINNMQYNTPMYEAITAVLDARQYNTVIREESSDFLQSPGKLRQLKITFLPQACDIVDTDTTTINVCAPGEVREPEQIFFSIKKLKKSKAQTFYPDNLRFIDGEISPSDYAMEVIKSTMGALEKSLSIDIMTDIIAHKGVHLDGSDYGQRVAFSNTTTGVMTPVGLWAVMKEAADAAYSNTFIIGSTEVWNWKQGQKIAVDNTYTGLAVGRIDIPHLYYDINLNTIMGVSPTSGEFLLTFDPQALKFVSWNRNAGIFATSLNSVGDLERAFKSGTDTAIRGTFKSPRYNLLWDFYANYVACVVGQYSGQWNWHMELNWDIVYPPIQTCNIEGVNGIMIYRTCPVVVPDCPTGTALSPAVAPRVFNYTPAISYPTTISDLTLGGQNSKPNRTVANIADLAAAFNDGYSSNATFIVVGSQIRYTGYTPISGSINGTTTVTFA